MIDDIKNSFDLKLSEIAEMQQVCEKNIVSVEKLNRAAENIKENSDKICIELEHNKNENKKINDEIKTMAEKNKKVTNKMTFAEAAKTALPDKKMISH